MGLSYVLKRELETKRNEVNELMFLDALAKISLCNLNHFVYLVDRHTRQKFLSEKNTHIWIEFPRLDSPSPNRTVNDSKSKICFELFHML